MALLEFSDKHSSLARHKPRDLSPNGSASAALALDIIHLDDVQEVYEKAANKHLSW